MITAISAADIKLLCQNSQIIVVNTKKIRFHIFFLFRFVFLPFFVCFLNLTMLAFSLKKKYKLHYVALHNSSVKQFTVIINFHLSGDTPVLLTVGTNQTHFSCEPMNHLPFVATKTSLLRFFRRSAKTKRTRIL